MNRDEAGRRDAGPNDREIEAAVMWVWGFDPDRFDYAIGDHQCAVAAVAEWYFANRGELAALREKCKPTSPPYLLCMWHADFDDTCPWCLRHRLAILEAAARDLLAAWDGDDRGIGTDHEGRIAALRGALGEEGENQ